ncbi:MAG: aminopeptidase P family protein [Deltaproteobacteria bacterium]|nr:aminopeptidase P family protein [Deltaproteobacteria bacterium]
MNLEPITSAPNAAEMARRLARVRKGMAAENLDAYVVHCPDNVFYLTNFHNYVHERPFVLVIPQEGALRFVVPHLEEEHVRVRAVGPIELVRYFEFPAPAGETWADRLRDALGGAARVGVESVCPLQVAEEVHGERVRSDIVDEARMVKTDYEIGRVVHASQIISEGHAELMAGSRPDEMIIGLFSSVTRSMTGRMLRDMPHANMLASSFAAVVQPPSVSHDPHNFTDVFARMEQGGPHVSVINCRVNGYGAEIERSFFLNSVPEAARRPFDVMMEARRIAFEKMRPGELMSEVDQAVRDHFEKHGYLDALLHRTGHSFGVTGHEAPFLAVSYERPILPGMLFSIEPGVYLPGVGGFRHSDTVLVIEDGNVSLTQADDELDTLTFER